MHFRRIRLPGIALLILTNSLSLTAWLRSASGEVDCPTAMAQELKNAIRESDLRVRNGGKSPESGVGFFQGRSLYSGRNSYLSILGAGFIHHLDSLGPEDRWIDIGAGPEFTAMREYHKDRTLSRNGKAQLVPMNVTDDIKDNAPAVARVNDFKKESGAEVHADGRTIEEYKKGEIKPGKLVTDVVAAVSYSASLHRVIESAGNMLVEGGWFDSVLFESWAGESCVTIVDQYGKKVPVSEYLQAVQGMKLVFHSQEEVAKGIHAVRFSLQRTTGDVIAPTLIAKKFKNASGKSKERQVPQIEYLWVR